MPQDRKPSLSLLRSNTPPQSTRDHHRHSIPSLKTAFHLVVPAFRESVRLPIFLPDLCKEMEAVGNVTVAVVDDGSGAAEAEATRQIVDDLRADFPLLQPLLALPQNVGKGGAVYAGWNQASREADWLGFVDADGSCPAREVSRLIQLCAVQDPSSPSACFASRIKMLGRDVERQLKRHLIGRIYATLVSEILKVPVYDSQCGLKWVPHDSYRKVQERLQITGFAFDVELMTALMDSGTRVIEAPIDWHETPGGKVHLLRDSWRMFRDILNIRANRPRPHGWAS